MRERSRVQGVSFRRIGIDGIEEEQNKMAPQAGRSRGSGKASMRIRGWGEAGGPEGCNNAERCSTLEPQQNLGSLDWTPASPEVDAHARSLNCCCVVMSQCAQGCSAAQRFSPPLHSSTRPPTAPRHLFKANQTPR